MKTTAPEFTNFFNYFRPRCRWFKYYPPIKKQEVDGSAKNGLDIFANFDVEKGRDASTRTDLLNGFETYIFQTQAELDKNECGTAIDGIIVDIRYNKKYKIVGYTNQRERYDFNTAKLTEFIDDDNANGDVVYD